MAEEQPNLEATMGLIMNGGNAKGFAFEAIRAAKKVTLKKLIKN